MLLQAVGIEHLYGAVKALDGVGLEVHGGELLTILGPSGSGKTSLLRVLGGFEMPDKSQHCASTAPTCAACRRIADPWRRCSSITPCFRI